MLERLKARGLRICVWINPYIAQRSPLFAEGKANGYLLRRPGGDVWQWDRWQPGHGGGGLHQSRSPRVVRGQAARAARRGRGLLQDRLRRADPHRRRLCRRLRPGADAQLLHLPLQQDRLRACSASTAARARRWSSRAPRRPGPAVPGALGRRLRVHLRVHGREPARRAVAGPVGLRLLEPRHRRLRGHPGPGPVQALDRVRPAVLAQPPARQRLLPGALAVRRGSGGRAALVHQAEVPADALPVPRPRCRPHRGRPDDARHDAGVPGRPGLHPSGSAVHAGRRPARGAGLRGGRRGSLLRAGGQLDALAHRRRR